MMEFLWQSLAIGVGGTVAMDIWALVLHAAFGMALPNWGLVGRWFAHLPKGKFFHDDITASQPVSHETAWGWFWHYAIGILYGAVLVYAAGPSWVAAPTFLPAWIVGLVTVGAGWFVLQPGMGAGWAASLRPNANQIRALNLIAHTVFALGMYAAALVIAKS